MAKDPYPGNSATPEQLLQLAEEYRKAADALLPTGEKGSPTSFAPWRLLAIYAIELYLNASLLHFGLKPDEIRGLQHDMAARAELAIAKELSSGTAAHLATISTNREYLRQRMRRNVRLCAELGADIVKTNWPGDADSFAKLVEAANGIPVVLAGGSRLEDKELLSRMEQAMAAGAIGCSVGRNIFMHRRPRPSRGRCRA